MTEREEVIRRSVPGASRRGRHRSVSAGLSRCDSSTNRKPHYLFPGAAGQDSLDDERSVRLFVDGLKDMAVEESRI